MKPKQDPGINYLLTTSFKAVTNSTPSIAVHWNPWNNCYAGDTHLHLSCSTYSPNTLWCAIHLSGFQKIPSTLLKLTATPATQSQWKKLVIGSYSTSQNKYSYRFQIPWVILLSVKNAGVFYSNGWLWNLFLPPPCTVRNLSRFVGHFCAFSISDQNSTLTGRWRRHCLSVCAFL